MFELTFLGTAASVPSPERGLPALIVQNGTRRFLVDCGEGTQRQIMQSGAGFKRLDTVLLTHGHLDHVLGLAGLAATLGLWEAVESLTVHGGPAALRIARTLLCDVTWGGGEPSLPLRFAELRPGVFWECDEFAVTAFPVRHSGPDSFGFRFQEPLHRPMLRARLDALQVPNGPERTRLARGEPVVLADRRRIAPDDVLGPPLAGGSVAVIGDAASTEDLLPHVRGVDLLVIEATFRNADADAARARSHLTVGDAAQLAAKADVGSLYLTHISSRYRSEEIEAEARRDFANAHVAEDFARVQVRRRGEAR